MTIPLTKYGHSLNTYFRYLTCLLDRGHITLPPNIFILFYSGSRPSYMILNSPYTCAQFRIVTVHFFVTSNVAKYKALRRAVSLGKTLL